MNENYLTSAIKQFQYYKLLGEKAIAQVPDHAFHWKFNGESNSIAILVHHLSGNMLSRWTDIFNTDGEKEWRDRESEFEDIVLSRLELLQLWEKGWDVLFTTLRSLSANDLERIMYIRNLGHTVLDAINRQLAHYPYHVGQLVFISKMVSKEWKSLSIPRGGSVQYNIEKFSQEKSEGHFTDEYLKEDTFYKPKKKMNNI